MKVQELDKADIATFGAGFRHHLWYSDLWGRLSDYMACSQPRFYQGLRERYLCYADMEVAYVACDRLKKWLENMGVKVMLEIGEGVHHGYPVIDIVRDAKPGICSAIYVRKGEK